MDKFDASFGRLKPYYDKTGRLYHVSIVWDLSAGVPMYASGRAMLCRRGSVLDMIFNPLRFNFNITRLKVALYMDFGEYDYVITEDYNIGQNGLVAVDSELWKRSGRVSGEYVASVWDHVDQTEARIYKGLSSALRDDLAT